MRRFLLFLLFLPGVAWAGDTSSQWGNPAFALKFREGVGVATFDSSGKGNHGTLIGGANWKSDRKGGCFLNLDKNGTDQYVKIANNPALNVPSFTIVMVASPAFSNTGSFNPAFMYGFVKGDSSIVFLKFYSAPSGSCGATGLGPYPCVDFGTTKAACAGQDEMFGGNLVKLSTNVLTHFVFTQDGATKKIYINGRLDTVQTGVSGQCITDATPLYFGANPVGSGTQNFKGEIKKGEFYARDVWSLDRVRYSYSQFASQTGAAVILQ